MGLHYSTFPLFRAAPPEESVVGEDNDVGTRPCLCAGGTRDRVGHRPVPAIATAHSVFRMDPMALHHGFGFRCPNADLGIQRIAFNGAVGMDREGSDRKTNSTGIRKWSGRSRRISSNRCFGVE